MRHAVESTSTLQDGDTITLNFNNPYEYSSASLYLNRSTDSGPVTTFYQDFRVASAKDDAYSSKDWSMLCAGEKILRLDAHSICGHCSGFLRFSGISGLHGARITNAYTEILRNHGEGNASLKISAENAASPTQISYLSEHRSRPRTSASVDWSGTLSGGWNQSPSLVPIIQELADNYDPSAIQFFLDDDGTTTYGNS